MPFDAEKLVHRLNRLLYSRKLLVFLGVAGALLTTLVAVALHRFEAKAADEALLSEVHDRARFLARELDASVEALYTLAEVVRYVAPLPPDTFEDVADAILVRNPGILALEWLPHVKGSQLAEFERSLQSYHIGYQVMDVLPDNSRRDVEPRADHFPVAYVVPYAGNLAVLGVDFFGSETRRATLKRAWNAGSLAASPPLRLLQLDSHERGLLLVLPVFQGRPETVAQRKRALRGFVVAAIDMKAMVDTVFSADRYSARYVRVEDVTNPDDPVLLYESDESRPEDARTVSLAPVGGRVLRISLAPRSGRQSPLYLPGVVAFAGGLMILVVCGYLWLLQRRGELVSAQVAQQTQELRQMNFRLATLSVTDPLTGLSNRRAFDDYLEQEWNRALREQTPVALLMIDVDHFKKINDNYGHPGGDAVLRELARRLQNHFKRPADRVARFGGEEFAVILPNTAASAEHQAERFRNFMAAEEIEVGVDQRLSARVSGGLAVMVPREGLTPRDLVKSADEALYRAKRQGRNRICVIRDGLPSVEG